MMDYGRVHVHACTCCIASAVRPMINDPIDVSHVSPAAGCELSRPERGSQGELDGNRLECYFFLPTKIV